MKNRPPWMVITALIVLGYGIGLIQTRAKDAGGVDLFSRVAQGICRPGAAFLTYVADWTGGLASGVWRAPALTRRVSELENEVARLKSSIPERMARLERENTRLRSLMGMPARLMEKSVGADIIGYFPDQHRIQLNVGENDGVKPGAPVVAPRGLLGQVVETSKTICYANLITNPEFSVGARVARTESQVVGIVRGRGDDILILEVYPETADAQVNDRLITSGISATYPEGILIGTVLEVSVDRNYGIRQARVIPSANMAKVREVRVLIRP
ncbi:MAG: Cell shape-determining protein MreC [Fimbriimonadales bacterium]|nr:Cell shape-determining protein MreC [Fimbriimonadales bacterium]